MTDNAVFIIMNILGVFLIVLAITKRGIIYAILPLIAWVYCIFVVADPDNMISQNGFIVMFYIGVLLANLYVMFKVANSD